MVSSHESVATSESRAKQLVVIGLCKCGDPECHNSAVHVDDLTSLSFNYDERAVEVGHHLQAIFAREIAAADARAITRAAAITDAYFAEVGTSVECTTCRRDKAPRGRSVPDAMAGGLCDRDCVGWYEAPVPGDLWPGERRADFGYPKLGDLIRAAVSR